MHQLERNHPAVLAFFLIALFITVLTLLVSVPDANAAQPAVTPRSRGSIQVQVPAVQGNLQATVEAAGNTLQSQAENYSATIESIAGQSAELIAATVTAISAQIGDSSDELEALLSTLTGQGSVRYDAGTLTATAFISEAQINALLDVVIEAAGYEPNAASVDTKADGTLDVILVDISGDLSGTLVITYQFSLTDGTVTATLVGVTLNGRPIPAESLPDDLVSAVELAVNAAAVQPLLNAAVAYTVNTLAVSENGILLGVSVTVAE